MVLHSESKSNRRPARDVAEQGFTLPPELCARLAEVAPGEALDTPQSCRAALAFAHLCDPAHPPVTLELYGGLRLRAGCRLLPMHADSVGQALIVLQAALPNVRRILPAGPELAEHYRFSLNGKMVTADLEHPLDPNDHVIVFSASVGG